MIKFSLVTLFIIVLLSFGQSTKLTLWQDDNALIFKLQHIEEPSGVFGPGPFGLGPYRYVATPLIPLYKLFGMSPQIFYIFAIIFYYLAAISVWFLIKYLTKNNLLGLLSGSIFAAGYIGSEGILRLFNTFQTIYSIIFVCLLIFFLHRFATSKKSWDYILAIIIFALSLESASIRTQYLIFPVIVFFLIFNFTYWRSFSWIKGILLAIPFIAIYRHIILLGIDHRSKLFGDYISGLQNGHFEYLFSFFATLGNIIIPSPLNNLLFDLAKKISLDYSNRLFLLEAVFLLFFLIIFNFFFRISILLKVLFSIFLVTWLFFILIFFHDSEHIFIHSQPQDTQMVFSSFIGGLFLILTSYILLKLLKNTKVFKLSVCFLSLMLFNILFYSIYLPFTPLESIHRYLTHSLLGFSIFLPLALFYTHKTLNIVVTILVVLLNILFSITYQSKFIKDITIPTNNFYSQLKNYVPEIKKGVAFYFDIADDEISQQNFRDFFSVGSMPDSTAIAIRYGIDRYDFDLTSDFNEFVKIANEKAIPQEKIFGFFYSAKSGLIDTSNLIRQNLFYGEQKAFNTNLQDIDIKPVTPVVLEIVGKANFDVSLNESCVSKIPTVKKKLFFDYLLSKDSFKDKLKVLTLSEEKYLKTSFLLDGKFNSLWRGGRGWWLENHREEILVDLLEVKSIGQFLWVNGYANSTPTNYTIEVSLDGLSWKQLKQVISESKKDDGLLVIENFEPSNARFIKLAISDTFDHDSPVVGEVEVVDDDFTEIDKHDLLYLESQANCIKNEEEKNYLTNFLMERGIEAVVSWKTDKSSDNVVRLNLKADGDYHNYKIKLPAGGTILSDLKIEPVFPEAKIDFSGIGIIYPDKLKLYNEKY